MHRLGAMGPRAWAAIGNILRISAVFGYLSTGLLGYQAIELNQHGAPSNVVFVYAGAAAVSLVVAILLWNLKGPLIRGNLIVQFLVGAYMLLWIISTLGVGLIFIGVVYLFTGEPDETYFYTKQKAPKPRFKPPANWNATGRIGPSGATLYANPNRETPAGIFDSWIPVQVMDKHNGWAQVVAESGEGGWIDLRTLTEGV